MHELLLYGQLPASRHEQLMKVLAGLTAMQPQRVVERHVLFRPTHGPIQAVVQKGGSQGVGLNKNKKPQQAQQSKDLYYTHLVKVVGEDDFGIGREAMDVDDHVTDDEEEQRVWQWQFQDLPEGGKRAATFRMAESIDITSGDPEAYMNALGYKYVSEYVIEGHRFVLDNTILFLHRILSWNTPPSDIKTSLPAFSNLSPLDPSGAYLLEAKIRLSESNPVLIKIGEGELTGLQKHLKGVLDMRPPERLALDTRVR